MACGGRVWKGDTITISVPFDVSGYTDLTISYYTDGEMKVVKSESDVEIEDGFITYTFLPGELDTIADGVIRYQIDYSVDNVDYVTGTNTMSYLKTPKTYSAKTTEEYYEEGFSSGYTQGEEVGYASGHTDGYTEGHEIGYEEGHAQGKQDGEEVGYNDAVSDIRNQSVSLSVTANGVYKANTDDSIYFKEVNVNVPQSSGGSVDLSWAGKSCAFEGEGWKHGEDPDDEYDYQPFFTLPNFGSFDQFSYDIFVLDTTFPQYLMTTQDIDGGGHYLNIISNNSGFTVEYGDNGNPRDHEVHIPCTMYAYSNYHIDITFDGSRDNMKIIVVGPDGQSAVSATTTITQFNPSRQMCINGIYDSDLHIYDYVRGGFMFRNMRIYGTGSLVHNYQWYDGHIVDTVTGTKYYGRHYYWDEDENQWDTDIKYMNGYNDAYKS